MSFLSQKINQYKFIFRRYRQNRKKWLWKNSFYYAKYLRYEINDKLVLCETQYGKTISGNVFYIAQTLANDPQFAGYEICMTIAPSKRKFAQSMLDRNGMGKVKLVDFATKEYFKCLATAKYLFNDVTFNTFFVKREEQVYCNMWHGTPLKTLGKMIKEEFHTIGNAQRNFMAADLLQYPNEFTKEQMVRDYMLENFSKNRLFYCGYARNAILLDDNYRQQLRKELGVENKRVYAYMPTFRGTSKQGKNSQNQQRLRELLDQMEAALGDDEELFLNLHPVSRDSVDASKFTRIKFFDKSYETYQFLSIADVLITDYSSVFFDFAASGRKIVLYPYDQEEYFQDRGTYLDFNELPFAKVYNNDDLFAELRSGKNYDDTSFRHRFNAYDRIDAPKAICDLVINNSGDLKSEPLPDNGKKNILVYGGGLQNNGVSHALQNFFAEADRSKYNFRLLFRTADNEPLRQFLQNLPDGVDYFGIVGDWTLTKRERFMRLLWKHKFISAGRFAGSCREVFEREYRRLLSLMRIDTLIQYEGGYGQEIFLLFATTPYRKISFVHSDMFREMKLRNNCRKDVFDFACQKYDHIFGVSQSAADSMLNFDVTPDKISVAYNIIPQQAIAGKARQELDLTDFKKASADAETIGQILDKNVYKFVTVGRFSPEKGHFRLLEAFAKFLAKGNDAHLFIIGGRENPGSGYYGKTLNEVTRLNLTDKVTLIMGMTNPMPLMSRCDGFIFSSLYEGFGLVLAEAALCGLPSAAADVVGVHEAAQFTGTLLVDNSVDGLIDGLDKLYQHQIPVTTVDFTEYNRQQLEKIESWL